MLNKTLAPIVLFVHARPEHTRRLIESLLSNPEASSSELHIFSDGARERPGEAERVMQVRDYVRAITGFQSVKLYESPINKGLAQSIIDGVTNLFENCEHLIVLEDDLVLSPGFLAYMNQALDTYSASEKVLSISGYSFPIRFRNDYPWDVAFGVRASSWGWATWKDRWEKIDWEVKDYAAFKHNWRMKWKFNRGGSDLCYMLDKHQRGVISSWAIRFCYHQFKYGMVDVFPVRSLVDNVGFGLDASNCTEDVNGWKTDFWVKTPATFLMPDKIELDASVVRDFASFNSLFARAVRVMKRLRMRLRAKGYA